jgi:hypothetical protein
MSKRRLSFGFIFESIDSSDRWQRRKRFDFSFIHLILIRNLVLQLEAKTIGPVNKSKLTLLLAV